MPVKVSMIQLDMRYESPEANVGRAERMIADAPESDIYILPETFATGFVPDRKYADARIGLDMMQRVARRSNCAVCGSLAVADGGRLYNRHFFVTPDGIEHYDKRHLFSIGGEGGYTAGRDRRIVEWRGMRWLLATCYDLRFPVWLRCRDDYDAIVCVASWPESRAETWTALLKARAIENLAYVAGVNRAGDRWAGGSAAVDFCGRTMAGLGTAEGTATVMFDRTALQEFRLAFPAGRDADWFELKNQDYDD